MIIVISLSSFLFLSTDSALTQEEQWVTYENPYFGMTIQHPSNWEVVSSNTDASPPPPRFAKQIVELSSPPELDAHLTIHMAIAESSLDTETMQVKNSTLEDFVAGKKSEIFGLSIPSGEFDFQKKLVRDNKTTVAGFPAWRIESISSVMGMQGAYYINTLVMKDGHMFDLEFSFDSLRAAEALPVIQKMIDSFRITTPTQVPVSTPTEEGPALTTSEESAEIGDGPTLGEP
jgi:hypothetical protein